ncbi:hypothetical protein [Methylobacterium sp. PvR107]|nr:hypothetical protein [Methylobacterium sp. PvR107]MBP1181647.1 hypothetical protein [Methylobacterium sp. PvR107]
MFDPFDDRMGIPLHQDVERGDHSIKRVNVTSIVTVTAYLSAAVASV